MAALYAQCALNEWWGIDRARTALEDHGAAEVNRFNASCAWASLFA